MLLRLKVHNAKYFNEKLKVKDIDIAFDKYKGITAIWGDNGLGKSSILEFSLPYRWLPSRPGKFSNHFIDGKGYVSRTWEHNHCVYEFIIKCSKTKTDHFIYQYINGEPVSLMTTTLSAEYDEIVEKIFGADEVFTRTNFKNRTDTIGNLNESSKIDFFLNLIGGRVYREIKTIISKQKSTYNSKLQIIESHLETIKKEIAEKNPNQVEVDIEKYKKELDNIYKELDEINEKIKLNLDLDSNLNKYNTELENLKNNLENSEINKLLNEHDELGKLIDSNSKLIEENKKYIELYDSPGKEKYDLFKDERNLLNHYLDLKKEQFNLSSLKTEYNEIFILNNRLIELKNIISNNEREYAEIQKNKCNVDPAECKLTYQIENSKKNLHNSKVDLESFLKENPEEEINKKLINIKEKLTSSNFKSFDELNSRLKTINTEVEPFTKEKEDELKTKSIRINEILMAKGIENINLLDDNKKYRKKLEELELQIKISKTLNLEYQNRIDELVIKISEINNSNSDTLQKQKTELELNKESITSKYLELTFIKKLIDEKLIKKNELEKDLIEVNEKINRYVEAEAFCHPKEGMPMIKLATIGQDFQRKANHILSKFHDDGDFYQVNFVNKKRSANNKRDMGAFDIIINNSSGQEINLNHLSSGQQIIIEIGLAFSLLDYDDTNSNKTLLIDELDGSLHANNVDLLFKTLRIAQEELGLEQIFIVTHNQILSDYCAQRIDLEIGVGTY